MNSARPSSPLSLEERLAISHDFLRRVGRETTLPDVLNRVEEMFGELLPESCLYLWLLDEAKQKICRIVYVSRPDHHAELPPLLDITPQITHWIRQADDSDTPIRMVEAEKMGELACPAAHSMAYLSTKTVDGLHLLLTICLPHPEALDNVYQRFISVLAHYAFQAIEKVRLKAEKDLLAQISNLANRSRSRDDFLRQVVSTIRDAFFAGGCTILLHDKSKEKLVLEGTTGLIDPNTGESLDSLEYAWGEGCTGWIWEHCRIVRMFDARDKNEWLTVDPTGSLKIGTKSAETHEGDPGGPRQFLGAPILLGPSGDGKQKVVGVIRIHKKLYGFAFLPYDERLLAVICEVFVPAIERWNITTEMKRQIALQESLFDIIEAMHVCDEADADEILEIIAMEARDLFNAYGCGVLVKEPNEDKLRVVKDLGPRPSTDIVLDFGEGLCGYAVLHRKTIAVPDVHHVPPDAPYSYHKVDEEVKSEICTPIMFGDECLGVLNVDSNRAGAFRPEDEYTIGILETFAKQAAIVLHRAQMLQEREQWRQNLVRTTQILTASNVASGLAHELKNGLAAISTMAEKLEPDPAIKMKKTNRTRLERIRQVSNDLLLLALRLMDLSKVGEPHKHLVYLNEMIEERVKILKELALDKKIKLVTFLDSDLFRPPQGEGHPLEIDERQMQQVLTNLVLNAIDASIQRQRIEVRTQRNPSQEWVTFSVRDFGKGITFEDKKHLFEMFFTTKPDGFGVGLMVANILVKDNHGGKIEVETKVNKGTTFTVYLPKLRSASGGMRR